MKLNCLMRWQQKHHDFLEVFMSAQFTYQQQFFNKEQKNKPNSSAFRLICASQ